MVMLTGAGGVGKTRLALELVARHVDDIFERVAYCDLSVVTDSELVAPAVVAALREVHEGERVVLIVDNCEHLLAQARTSVDDVLESMKGVAVLATSREPLGIEGEAVLRLVPLPLPVVAVNATVEDAARSPAVALFVDRASLADDGFIFDEVSAPLVREIVSRVEGIPLAIEIAASGVATATLSDISESLRNHLRGLAVESATHEPRHRSAHALVDWSYRLLDVREQTVFRSLAVFMGSFTVWAVEHVVGDRVSNLDAVVRRLVHKSLLFVEGATAPTRYRMLETVRQYAALKLLETGEGAALHLRHALYVDDVLTRAESDADSIGQQAQLASIAADLNNVRQGLEFATSQSHNLHLAAAMCAKLFTFWDARGDFSEGEMWLRRALACDPELCPIRTRALLLEGLALLLFRQGLLDDAMTHAEQSQRSYEAIGDAPGRLRVSNLLGIAALDANDSHTARTVFERNLRAAEDSGSVRQIVVALNNLGRVRAEFDDDLEGSLVLFQQSLTKARSAGMLPMAAAALGNLSESSAKLKRYGDALEYARRGALAAVEIGNESLYASFSLRIAICRIRIAGYPRARAELSVAREAIAKHRYRVALSYELDGLAEALFDAGHAEGAALLLGAFAALREGAAGKYPLLEKRHRETEIRVRSVLGTGFVPIYLRGKTFALDEALAEATNISDGS
ncbi:MAG: hypothetical protein M3R53_00530 [Candidatus Eremiobacteraeota bacterium]|nr:hypothetical protein [Candidatus Eremiobacteraeota bacterium]